MEMYLEQNSTKESGVLCVDCSVGNDFDHRQPY
jgi:hypothetical protein